MTDHLKILGDPANPSEVEGFKQESQHLRGKIDETMRSGETDHFGDAEKQLIKFHGIYQQDNRDSRNAAKAAGEGKVKTYSFMVRVKVPGGALTSDQYLALDHIADQFSGNASLRLTTRQGIQFHGIVMADLRTSIYSMNQALLSTLAACGDVNRNVMCSPAALATVEQKGLLEAARLLSDELCPRTTAYHEIWVDGQQLSAEELGEKRQPDEEPLYGKLYLPRKFKVGLAFPEDNSPDVYSQDLGFIAIVEDGQIVGYNVLAGGGLGMSHLKAKTYARIASELGFVYARDLVSTAKAILTLHRDYGDRSDRKHARLKYVVEEWGTELFVEKLKERMKEFDQNAEMHSWRPIPELGYKDYLGVSPQGDGKFTYGLFVENGRVIDNESHNLKSACKQIASEFRPQIIVTPNQNLLFTQLEESALARIEEILVAHRVKLPSQVKGVRRYSMACPALPTCGLALAESERVLPSIVDRIEERLEQLGLADEPITVRMTGCPNGCARPYTADIAFVGRQPGKYDVYVGGTLSGQVVGDLYAERVQESELAEQLEPLFVLWAKYRQPEESLGAYYQRNFHQGEPRRILTGAKEESCRPTILAASGMLS